MRDAPPESLAAAGASVVEMQTAGRWRDAAMPRTTPGAPSPAVAPSHGSATGHTTTTGTGAYLAPRHRSRLASRRTLDRSSPARIAKHGTRARLPAPIPRALAGAVLHVALVGAVEHRLLSAIRTSTGTSTYRSTCTSTGSSGTSLTRISASARRRLVSPPYQASPRRLRSLLNFLSSARITDRRFAFGVLPFALTPNVSSSIRAVP